MASRNTPGKVYPNSQTLLTGLDGQAVHQAFGLRTAPNNGSPIIYAHGDAKHGDSKLKRDLAQCGDEPEVTESAKKRKGDANPKGSRAACTPSKATEVSKGTPSRGWAGMFQSPSPLAVRPSNVAAPLSGDALLGESAARGAAPQGATGVLRPVPSLAFQPPEAAVAARATASSAATGVPARVLRELPLPVQPSGTPSAAGGTATQGGAPAGPALASAPTRPAQGFANTLGLGFLSKGISALSSVFRTSSAQPAPTQPTIEPRAPGTVSANPRPPAKKPPAVFSNPLNADALASLTQHVGGLDKQFEAIFRRAFTSRVYPPSLLQKLGIKHVKGILLFGPPGTGKTLIARQIGKVLNGKEPKVVNGPEVLNKYLGQSEENIRNLFAEADEEYKAKGDASGLHVIIFDEIDAVCRQRGSVRDGSGVHDTVVNQLLTKMDGVDALNNILVIGMTNRKDMLDEALLRPGRLEVLIEIGLPDEAGRHQILKIHTNKMSENSFLSRDVDLEDLAGATKNFSGAELEGLVKDAAAYALARQVDPTDLNKPLEEKDIQVAKADFERALEEVPAAFGATTETLKRFTAQHGIIPCGEQHEAVIRKLGVLWRQLRMGDDKTRLLACVLDGPLGSGKSAIAAISALKSEFPFVKVISAETLVGCSEQFKSSQITRVFEDAYRSPLSIVILDGMERLLDYVAIGPRFSNTVLQTLLVHIKGIPPPGKKLLIIGTTSAGEAMETLGLSQVFMMRATVPALDQAGVQRVVTELGVFDPADMTVALGELQRVLEERQLDNVAIKPLLLWIELAKQGLQPVQPVPLDQWRKVLADFPLSRAPGASVAWPQPHSSAALALELAPGTEESLM